MTTLQSHPSKIREPFWAGAILSPVTWNERLSLALEACEQAGRRRVVLYGAGYHTRQCWAALAEPPVAVLAIVDDAKGGAGRRLWGFPVVTTQEALALQPDAVVLSSNTFEDQLWERAVVFREHGIEVVRPYGPPPASQFPDAFDARRMEFLAGWEYQQHHREKIAAVRGWLASDEESLLYVAARWSTAVLKLPILEIGAAWGRSTGILALASCAAPTPLPVVSIDPHTGDIVHLKELEAKGEQARFSSLEQFRMNIRALGVEHVVRPIVKTSADAAAEVGLRPFGLVWIDGSHAYEDVCFDLRFYGALVAPGGVIAMHDYEHPPVRRAIEEWWNDQEWTAIERTQSKNLAFCRRLPRKG